MAEYNTSFPKKKKKKWTKKRIRRYARAWFFRILFVLILLLALFLVVSGVKAMARGISHLFSGGGSDPKVTAAADSTDSADEMTGAVTEEASAEGEEAVSEAATEAPTVAPTEAPTEAYDPVIQKLTLTAAGNCTLGTTQSQGYEGSFTEYYDKNGANYFFSHMTDLFAADDLTLVNLECVLSESTNRVDKQINLKGKPEYTSILTGSSVEAVTLGNNHTADYGEYSLKETEKNLTNAGVKWAIDSQLATFKTDDGLVVGIVSKEIITVSPEKEQVMLDGIQKLKNMGVNLIIACCHWGSEKDYDASEKQVNLAHDLIDAGADLVLGTHPYVLEGIEVYNGKVICYSLGNFSFGADTAPSDQDTMLYQQTFTFHDGKVQIDLNSRVIPCKLSSTEEYNDYQPKVVSGDDKKAIIDKLNTHSQRLGDVVVDSDGRLSADLTVAETVPETSAAEEAADNE